MGSTVKERLIEYLESKKISKSEFGRRIGVSSAFISSMRQSMQPDKLERVALNFPDLNMEWLLTGNGEMINDSATELGPAGKASADDVVQIPYIPVRASATFIESLCDEKEYRFDQLPVVPVNGEVLNSAQYKIFEVSGDSMTPTINDGALILVKEIEESKWAYAEGVVVVVFQDMVVVKRISRNDILNANYLILTSDNPKYGQMQVALSDIRAIYKAKRKISENIF